MGCDKEFEVLGYFLFVSAVDGAIKALNGRYFGGRIVQAQKYDQDMYAANDLSG